MQVYGLHIFFISLLLVRVLPSIFSLFSSRSLVVTSSLSRWFCLSLFVSHSESRGGGRWWWWSCPDGGGYGGGVVGSFVPILLPISFLSLWEGEEGPRSRALRTEFIIDRAISLTASRRSWTEAESSRFCLSLRLYSSVVSVSANVGEENTGLAKVRDFLNVPRSACLNCHTRFNSLCTQTLAKLLTISSVSSVTFCDKRILSLIVPLSFERESFHLAEQSDQTH